MIYISHRGNLTGSKPETENTKKQIITSLNLGFDVEIDLWYINKQLFLGHDNPCEKINIDFLLYYQNFLWCHAKNLEALVFLLHKKIHCFWHDKDYYTLTSNGIIWSYSGKEVNNKTVCVLPELHKTYNIHNLKNSYAICSDNISFYKQLIQD